MTPRRRAVRIRIEHPPVRCFKCRPGRYRHAWANVLGIMQVAMVCPECGDAVLSEQQCAVRDEKIKQHPDWLRLLAIMNGGAA